MPTENQSAAADQLRDLAEHLGGHGVRVRSMFGKPTLMDEGGKAFACLLDGELACRLGQGTQPHTEALALSGSHLFDPSGTGRAMKDWVAIPPAHESRWPEFASAALSVTH